MRWLMLICSCYILSSVGCQDTPPNQEIQATMPKTQPWAGGVVSTPDHAMAAQAQQGNETKTGNESDEELKAMKEEAAEVAEENRGGQLHQAMRRQKSASISKRTCSWMKSQPRKLWKNPVWRNLDNIQSPRTMPLPYTENSVPNPAPTPQ